jgi:hypothetical protein
VAIKIFYFVAAMSDDYLEVVIQELLGLLFLPFKEPGPGFSHNCGVLAGGRAVVVSVWMNRDLAVRVSAYFNTIRPHNVFRGLAWYVDVAV